MAMSFSVGGDETLPSGPLRIKAEMAGRLRRKS
jgi:hypothetical protein